MSLQRVITYLSLMSFLDLVTDLLADPAAKESYASDPQGWLTERGFGDLSPSELDRAMSHSSDALSPDVARSLGPNPSLETAAELDMEAAGISLDRPGLDESPDFDLDEDANDSFDLDADPSTDPDAVTDGSNGAASTTNAAEVEDTDVSPAAEFSSATDDSELTDLADPSSDPLATLGAEADATNLDADYETELDTDPDTDDFDDPLDGIY